MKFFKNLTMTLFVLFAIAAAKSDSKDPKTVECPNCRSKVNSDGTAVKTDESSSSDSGKSKSDSKKGSNTKDDKDKSSSRKSNGVDFQDTMTIFALVSSLLMTLQ
ncbi:hypothetical protein NBO_29g0013 [Nosema bombycis CQ1]|uniref:Uncharacterized protein n=1 Tax=Nosema bombycis (strain CQ1 / CVCC 102059) TaxID=578461 RepID=R0MJE4_NOSB1|nr:hypothetical protein NBO_29g0013 [Nosema bombycis CQ1]|eukprot:EOB14330.1 hypothetical protein NBO_29g0013 [Nosema bombycis CQ1]